MSTEDDLRNKLNRLSKSIHQGAEEQKQDRLRQWEFMKSNSPELAEMIKDLQAGGMKPKVIYYELKGEIINGRAEAISFSASTIKDQCFGCSFCRPTRDDLHLKGSNPHRNAKR
jgi:hypothetical protein